MMDRDSDTRRLNAIVGAAIKGLAESGADDEYLGAFAASHRAKVSRILGKPEEAVQPPDLRAMITEALKTALEEAGVVRQPPKQAARRFNVVIGGARTTVTLDPRVVSQLEDRQGVRGASATIKNLAESVPSDARNRSAWLEERVLALLNFRESNARTPPARH